MPSLQKRQMMRARAEQRAGGVELGAGGGGMSAADPFFGGIPNDAAAAADVDGSSGGKKANVVARNLGHHLAVLPILSLVALYVIVVVLGVYHPFSLAVLTFFVTFAILLIIQLRYEIAGSHDVPNVVLVCSVIAFVAAVIALFAAYSTAATAAAAVSPPAAAAAGSAKPTSVPAAKAAAAAAAAAVPPQAAAAAAAAAAAPGANRVLRGDRIPSNVHVAIE